MVDSRQPLKVLHVTKILRVGGIETYISALPRHVDPDIDIGIYLFSAGAELEPVAARNGAEIHHASCGDVTSWRALVGGMADDFRRLQPDIIHVHQEHDTTLAMLARLWSGRRVPLITHRHNHPMLGNRRSAKYVAQRLLLRTASRVVCCSEAVLRTHAAHYGLPLQRAEVVYCGVEAQEFMDLPPKAESRRRLSLREDETVFVFVGRFDQQQKGLDVLLNAIAMLARSCEHFTVLLVGDGPDRGSLQQQAEDADVAHLVRFTGMAERGRELCERLAASDVYVQPSRWEGLPLSVLEAMAAGLPVVATAVHGTPEAVAAGSTGILVPAEDASALAVAMERMIHRPDERRAMGAAGRRRVQERFDMRVTTAHLCSVYRAVAGA